MPEAFNEVRLPVDRVERYATVAEEIAAVLDGEPDRVARMAVVAGMLAMSFDGYFWAGFYLLDPARPGEMVIGPYQGSLLCLRIAVGRGVCGAAAATRRTQIVEDVDAFPGHIPCDGRSRSEIVVPVFDRGHELIGVFDVDSDKRAAFDQIDADWLERILRDAFAI